MRKIIIVLLVTMIFGHVLPAGGPFAHEAFGADTYRAYGYPWENNNIGYSDSIPAPWTPLTYEDKRVGCWGREYSFEKGVLPRQIASQGENVFSKDPSLEFRIEGRANTDFLNSALVQQSKSPHKAEYKMVSANPDYRAEGYVTLEYDGFLRIDVVIVPQRTVRLDSMSLNLPIRKEVAQYYSSFANYDYNRQMLDREASAEGIGPIDKPVYMGFNPAVWIGNDRIGVEWSCESNIGWSNGDQSKVIKIEPAGDTVTMSIHVVSRPATLSSPFTFSFAIYPTPVKKLPEDWRNQALVPSYQRPQALTSETHRIYGIAMGLPVKYPGLPLIVPSEGRFKMPGGLAPDKWIESVRSRMAKNGIKLVPYSALYGMPARLPMNEWKDYSQSWRTMTPRDAFPNKEWAAAANIPPGEMGLLFVCLYPRSFQDFYVWQFMESIKKHQIEGLYLDLAAPLALCRNTSHPHGESVKKGSQYYPFFAQRELMKRLYSVGKAIRPDMAIIVHQGKIPVVGCGFSDMVLSGEFLNTSFAARSGYDPDYAKFPESFYKIEFLQTRGFSTVLLPQIIKWDSERISGNRDLLKKYTQILLARTAIFDIPLYAARMDMEQYEAYLRAQQRFGWLGNARYIGPADSDKYVMGSGQGKTLRAALYLKPSESKLMMSVANFGNSHARESLSLNVEGLRALGLTLKDGYTVLNAIENKPHGLKNHSMEFSLGPNEYGIYIVQ